MAHEVIFITIAQTLATFNIKKPVVNGVVIHPSVERSEGVVRLVFLSFSKRTIIDPLSLSRPSAFEYVLKPRSEKAVALINEPVAE